MSALARILVVDDEVQNRTLLIRQLTRCGYEAEGAASGEEALHLVAERLPDVVLTDVNMPGIDGFAVCRSIKENPGSQFVPVVLITGMGDRDAKLRGIEVVADDFLRKPVDREELIARIRSLVRLKRSTDDLDSAESVILSLAMTVEARDPYTEGHCHRLARYSSALGRHLGLPDEDVEALHRGGYLHDVGKIGIPDVVLLKAGPLDAAEYALMKPHTLIGDRLCGRLRSLRLVRQIVRHHHEQLDGTGYPDALSGDAVPVLAQIVGIADVYDAVTTRRPDLSRSLHRPWRTRCARADGRGALHVL